MRRLISSRARFFFGFSLFGVLVLFVWVFVWVSLYVDGYGACWVCVVAILACGFVVGSISDRLVVVWAVIKHVKSGVF